MQIEDLPSLTGWQSLRFAWNPDRFMSDGRALGPVWRAKIGGAPIVVLSDQDLGTWLLGQRTGTRFFNDGPLRAWLGDAMLFQDGAEHGASRAIAEAMLEKMTKKAGDLAQRVSWCVCRAARQRLDVGAELLAGLVAWGCDVIAPGRSTAASAATMRWLRAADTLGLFVPELRDLPGARWRDMAPAVAEMDDVFGYLGPRESLVARLMLAGLADNPTMLALEVLARANGRRNPGVVVDDALACRPPVTLILRELTEEKLVAIPGSGVLYLPAGTGIAADTVAVRRPFGFGAHGCIGAALGRLVATTAIQGWPWGEFEPVPGPRGRRRLAIGYKSMSSRPCRGRY